MAEHTPGANGAFDLAKAPSKSSLPSKDSPTEEGKGLFSLSARANAYISEEEG